MIKTKQDLKYYLHEDAIQNKITSYYSYLLNVFAQTEHGVALCYLRALRHQEFYLNNLTSHYRRVLYYWYKFRTSRIGCKSGIHINVNTVGPGLAIFHLGGIVINCKKMGRHCSVNSGVILGRKNTNVEVPTIGDDVIMHTGCKIIGNINIGNNAVIAPNAVVIKNVPDNGIVAGVPAKIIKVRK